MKITSLPFNSTNKLNRSILASVLMAAAATVSQADKAAAVNLNFNDPIAVPGNPLVTTTPSPGLGSGPAYTNSVYGYRNVVAGIDAKITATAFTTSTTGSAYTFQQQLANYTSAGNSTGDTAFRYLANAFNTGGLNYKIELFQGGGTFSTAYVAPELRFLVYDVDGESTQGEAVRIAKNSGLVGYQVGTTSAALIPTAAADGSYLFSGKDLNQSETDSSSAAILYFKNVSSVNFQFEAVTRSGGLPNGVFSAIDGDLSILGSTPAAIDAAIAAQYSDLVVIPDTRASATDVPEPFTIIGTLVGGTAALRMRKKLKADKA